MKATALVDVPASGANAPGIKVIHLSGRIFVNPMLGDYPITMTRTAPDGRVLAGWQDQLKMLDAVRDARLAPSNFQLPPGANGDCQNVPTGTVAPQTLGLQEGGTERWVSGVLPFTFLLHARAHSTSATRLDRISL